MCKGIRQFQMLYRRPILELYAGWREFDGFVSDDAVHIISCVTAGMITDGILTCPADVACTGIEAAAGNPNYYSEGGILYTAAGEVAVAPVWYGE